MTTTDINGLVYYETTDNVTPLQVVLNGISTAVTNAFDSTDRIFPVANATARDALYTSRGAPLLVFREDAGVLERNGGTGWRRVAPFAEWFGTASTAADGTFSGTFPAGLFTIAPLVVCSVASGSQFAIAAAASTSTTAFSGHGGYFPGGPGAALSVTAGFVVAIHAVQATATSAVG